MNYCNLSQAPGLQVETKTPQEMAANIITFAKDKLKIDLSQYKDEMINAACRGQLEFSLIFGSGSSLSVSETKSRTEPVNG